MVSVSVTAELAEVLVLVMVSGMGTRVGAGVAVGSGVGVAVGAGVAVGSGVGVAVGTGVAVLGKGLSGSLGSRVGVAATVAAGIVGVPAPGPKIGGGLCACAPPGWVKPPDSATSAASIPTTAIAITSDTGQMCFLVVLFI